MPKPAQHGVQNLQEKGIFVMCQEQFETALLNFLKNQGGLVLYEQINYWKMNHPEYRDCSVETALESLVRKGLVECTDRGARAL